MPELLAELVAKITTDATELKKGLGEATHGVQSWVKENEKQFKAVGAALTGVGAAITGSLGMMTKAAIDEEVNINRLAITLKNLGVEYDDVKDSLEGVILATQRKTGIADNEQRDILGRLLLVTNDYNKALELMPTVLDLAAAGQMDATTAATYLGKAYLELQENEQKRIDIQAQLTAGTIDLETAQSELSKITDTVSVRFGQASLKFKDMEEIQKRVAGAAEATANPLNILKASMGDLAEKVGSFLIPILKDVVDKVVPILEKVQEWTDAHPELTRVLIILAAVLGGVALVLGPILIMLPMLVAGFVLLTGPIGLVIAAIMGLIAIGTLLILNWETIKSKVAEVWNNVVGVLHDIFNQIKTDWNSVVNFILTGINWLISGINSVIGLINKVPGINIGTVGKMEVPKMAQGGIVTQPTLAMIGEAGAEAVIPLSEMENRVIQNKLYLDGALLAQVVSKYFDREYRAQLS